MPPPAAFILLFSFLIVGYIYDRVLVLWGPQQEVVIERNPFQFVPHPRDRVFWFPIYSALLASAEELAKNAGVDTTPIDETREYYRDLQKLVPQKSSDIDVAIELRKEYIKSHSFGSILSDSDQDSEI